jgi:hypothetical protein
MVKLCGSAAVAVVAPEANGKGTTAGKILAPGGTLPLALRSSKQGKEDSGPAAISTLNRPAPKASCPQGTLLMARDVDSLELEDMELHTGEEESKTKSNPKSNDKAESGEGEGEDNTSIVRAIAGIKKDLFKVARTSRNYIQGEASKPKWWKLIPKVATALTPHEDGQPSVTKGAKFAEGTQFVEKVSAAKKTPGKDAKTND